MYLEHSRIDPIYIVSSNLLKRPLEWPGSLKMARTTRQFQPVLHIESQHFFFVLIAQFGLGVARVSKMA
jgi:hypothetical protein